MSQTTPCGPEELPTPAYPIYVIRIKRLLAMERMLTHEQLRDEKALVEWKAGDGHVLFASHTWLNHTHPDNERNEKLSLLKGWLGNILDGRAKDITPQWSQAQSGQGSEVKGLRIKAAKIRRDLLDGFVWLDLASIPQADRETQILAIQSIPHYIAACSYFAVVVGPFRHDQLGTPRGINEWCGRGWCRLEQLGNFLSPHQKPLLVVKSPTFVEAYLACGTILTPCWRTSVGEGAFTVDEDRVHLGPVILSMIERRRALALKRGELFHFRILHMLKDKLLRGTGTTAPREESCNDWLHAMRFISATDKDECFSAIHYAAVGGRVDIVEALLDAGAGVHVKTTAEVAHTLTWLKKGVPLLGVACHARNQPEMVRLLLSRGADISTVTKGIGDVAMWACISFQGRDDDPPGTEYNIDTLIKHDPMCAGTVMPLVACDGKMMMAAFAVSALKHYMRAYPEAAAADLKRIDGVGATILLHHMVYMSEVGYIQAILDAGFDLTHDGFTGEPGRFIHIMSRVMRILFRRMTFPPNDVFHFATMSPHHVPTYLHFAAAYAYVGALELLLAQNKLDINAGNKLGMTPLHLGAYMGHLSIVDILLNAGANPLVRDERKRTPAAWAARRGHVVIAATLRAAEAAAAGRGHTAKGGAGREEVRV